MVDKTQGPVGVPRIEQESRSEKDSLEVEEDTADNGQL